MACVNITCNNVLMRVGGKWRSREKEEENKERNEREICKNRNKCHIKEKR